MVLDSLGRFEGALAAPTIVAGPSLLALPLVDLSSSVELMQTWVIEQ
jgi:hypothetical protein